MKNKSISNFLNRTAISAFGLTTEEAHKLGICIMCKNSVLGDAAEERFYSRAGVAEYNISGLCEYCFDENMKIYWEGDE